MRTMQTRQAGHISPRNAAHALATVLVAASGLLLITGPAAAAASFEGEREADAPVLVVRDNSVTATDDVVFDVDGIGPGYRESFPLYVRNDASSAAVVIFEGFEYDGDGNPATGRLEENTTLTLRYQGVELGSGGAGDERLDGATLSVPAGQTVRLDSELVLAASVGNEAQGDHLEVIYNFRIATKDTLDDGTGGGEDGDNSQTLPPTGESLATFHALVWLTIVTTAVALVLALLAAVARRSQEELS